MTSLDRPSSARRMILARITSQYGDVYFLAIDSSAWRSPLERSMSKGLFLGIRVRTSDVKRIRLRHRFGCNNTSSYFRIEVLRQQLSDPGGGRARMVGFLVGR